MFLCISQQHILNKGGGLIQGKQPPLSHKYMVILDMPIKKTPKFPKINGWFFENSLRNFLFETSIYLQKKLSFCEVLVLESKQFLKKSNYFLRSKS